MDVTEPNIASVAPNANPKPQPRSARLQIPFASNKNTKPQTKLYNFTGTNFFLHHF